MTGGVTSQQQESLTLFNHSTPVQSFHALKKAVLAETHQHFLSLSFFLLILLAIQECLGPGLTYHSTISVELAHFLHILKLDLKKRDTTHINRPALSQTSATKDIFGRT